MRNQFSEYFALTENQSNVVWDTAIISLDANALLNVYRYSPETADILLQILKKYQGRLWLTYQAGLEFHRNRTVEISVQNQKYDEARKQVGGLIDLLDSPRKHPFIKQELLNEVRGSLDKLSSSLDGKKKDRESLFSTDPDLDSISALFHGKVGAEPEINNLEELKKIAKARIEKKIPPGYMDANKDSDKTFGDIFVWRQLIEKAAKINKPAIFVTDDAKEDWWLVEKGRTLGPRPELIKEFRKETGQDVLILRPDYFIQKASIRLGGKADEQVLNEIRKVSRDLSERRKMVGGEPAADPVSRIVSHAKRHRADFEQFWEYVSQLSRLDWKSLKSPLELDAKMYDDLQSCVNHCRCIIRIIEKLRLVSPAAWYQYRHNLNVDSSHSDLVAILHNLRKMPVEVLDCAKSMVSSKYSDEEDEW